MNVWTIGRCLVLVMFVLSGQRPVLQADELLVTTAESTEYRATSSYDDVMRFCRQLASDNDRVTLAEFGHSVEGRALPVLILSSTPAETLDDVAKHDRLVVLMIGNIHAGEVCGKEALQMLARDISHRDESDLLSKLTLLFVPIYNADGNELISTENRTNQLGPAGGVGQRENRQGLDLNRDHVKLEAPETRALVDLINRCDPAIVIDCHTTNGTYHRYKLTYDGPRHPAVYPPLADFIRGEMLPSVGERLKQTTGYDSFFFGNLDRAGENWRTYPAEPRYNTQYVGLRQRIGILSEAYAYATFEERVKATYGFVMGCCQFAAEHRDRIEEILKSARENRPEQIAVGAQMAPWNDPVTIRGYVADAPQDGQFLDHEAKDYHVRFWGQATPTASVQPPFAYLISPDEQRIVENLDRHGIVMKVLREDIVCPVEQYKIIARQVEPEIFQGHHLQQLQVESRASERQIEAGTIVVEVDQPLATLVVNLLEPQAADGLATWGLVARQADVGDAFPITRLVADGPLLTSSFELTKATTKQPITFDVLNGDHPPRLSGQPISVSDWLDDEHYMIRLQGQVYQVDALSGRKQPLYSNEALFNRLRELESLSESAARRVADGNWLELSEDHQSVLFAHGGDLYWADLQGKDAHRLTNSPGAEELASFSPDAKRVAFIRDKDLYVVDVETLTERRLTRDGNETTSSGKASWVYFEELYGRNWQAYRWSPDSLRLAFVRFDESTVDRFQIPHDLKVPQEVEQTRYPVAGRANPQVQLGIVDATGSDVNWLDLSEYSPGDFLISHYCWWPDSRRLMVMIQDRIQTWLDVRAWPVSDENESSSSSRLFRETTRAWVDLPGDPTFLNDGSFLWPSERTGWRHLYHYSGDGDELRAVSQGEWEVRSVEGISEDQSSVFVVGTRDSHLAEQLYRLSLDGTSIERLTNGEGTHVVRLSPKCRYFVDSESSRHRPTQVALRRHDGTPIRRLDSNPVPDLDRFRVLPVEFLQITTSEGTVLDASWIKPPDFDPTKHYPVWIQTYGGPHAPSLADSWRGGRVDEQMLAQMGIIAFRVDPRSASGKSAVSTWTSYRQLGVGELQDLVEAVDWLTSHPFVDAERIGLSGHSYGGFLTAFAMTHSDRFAAGISGAPVTDWRNYDTIYTERYMQTPQDNPDGYLRTSVVDAAAQLKGRLLLVHGMLDDNVHIANSLQLIEALQEANRSFELMIYPSSRHGIHGAHYQRLRYDFIRRTMLESSR